MHELGLEIRKDVLMYSLMLEQSVSKCLTYQLGLNDENVSFGNTTNCLSFNQKITLLLDMQLLKKEDKVKLTTFMAIRNKFMHSYDANTYEKCINKEQEEYLLKRYKPDSRNTKERNLNNAVIELGNDCMELTGVLFGANIRKANREANRRMEKCAYESLKKTVDMLKSENQDESSSEFLISFQDLFKKNYEELAESKPYLVEKIPDL